MCSAHFEAECFLHSFGRLNGCRLKSGAVPTIFEWSSSDAERPNIMDKVRKSRKEISNQSLPPPAQDEAVDLNEVVLQQQETITKLESVIQEKESVIQEQAADLQRRCMDNVGMAVRLIDQEIKQRDFEKRVDELTKKLAVERFGVERYGSNDELFCFYTGIRSVKVYYYMFNLWKPTADTMQRRYYQPVEDANPRVGRPSCMKLIDECFMLLVRLRLGTPEIELADRFNCSVSTVSRKLITWINYLYFILGSWCIWQTREKIQESMLQGFREKYPSTRVIIDCTEVKTQAPKSLIASSQLYSNYKSSHTYKGLLGMAWSYLLCVRSIYWGDVRCGDHERVWPVGPT